MHPPDQRYFGIGPANETSNSNHPENLNFQSPQHNQNFGPNFSKPVRIDPRSEHPSNQFCPGIVNGPNRPHPIECNGSKPYYPNLASNTPNTNRLNTIEENGLISQHLPGALQNQSKFNARFQEIHVNGSRFPPQAATANAPVPYQPHQWANGSSTTFPPNVVKGSNPPPARVEVDNRLRIHHPKSNGVCPPQCAIPISELRLQLASIARKIKLRTVESTSAASEHVKPEGNEEYLMLYLVVLGQYILRGWKVWYTNLPPPVPKIHMSPRATNSFSSSPVPFKLDKIKRESQKNDGRDRNEYASKTVSPIDTTNWDTVLLDPHDFELDDVDSSPFLDSGDALIEPENFDIDLDSYTGLPKNDAGYFSSSPPPGSINSNSGLSTPAVRVRSLSPLAKAFVPASESHQAVSGVDGEREPLKSSDNIILSGSHSEPAKARSSSSRMKSVSSTKEKMPKDTFVTGNSSNTTTPSVGSSQRTRPNLPTPLTPISPSLQSRPSNLGSISPRGRSAAHRPVQIPDNIYFIRTKPGTGIRICIFPETTWIDLPEVGIQHCNEDLPEIHYVLGSASWFFTKFWISRLYQEILTYGSFKHLEHLGKLSTQSAPEPSTIPTGYVDAYGRPAFFQADEPKAVLCPSGDDLGVNWNAKPAERRKIRLTKVRQMWEQWQEGARDARFDWHLWKLWGKIKGWTEKVNNSGDKANNSGDNANGEDNNMIVHYGLMKIALLTSKQGFGVKQMSFEEREKTLNGRSIQQFLRDWEERHKKFGSQNWLE
ncbi:hypothetical protein EAE96_011460 [Botrytis aclada]|nr:hypothetical protein EAE96_011460 [Botrytis aclada]